MCDPNHSQLQDTEDWLNGVLDPDETFPDEDFDQDDEDEEDEKKEDDDG